MDFYQGKVLRLDLSAGTSAVEPLNMEWAEKYIGGKGLLLRYMWDEVPPKVDPWAAENPVILMTGPFAGTNVSTASRLVVGCKSPQTGILNDSYVGGSFAPELKFAGYDAVIITGESPEPVVVTIKDDVVSFVPAGPKYWGMQTSQIEEALRQDFDPDAKTLSIGPGGEKEILWACLSTDQYHKAGRGGHGALWGHKKLKAIAVRGTGTVTVGDAKAFLDDMYRIHNEYVLTEDNLWANEEGTPVLGADHERRRRHPHAQLVDGHVRAAWRTSTPTRSSRSAPRTAPATSAPSAAASSTRSTASPARVRSTRPSRSAAPTAASATSPRS